MEKSETFLRGLPFFSELDDAVATPMLKAGLERSHARGENIFLQNDAASRMFIVLSGWVKLFRQTPDGDEAVLALLSAGDMFGEAAIFGAAGYPFSATAAEDAKVFEIPGDTLRTLAKQNHDVMARVMDSMSRELRNLQMQNEHLALMSAPQRVGCLLLQFSAGLTGAGGGFTLPYDKSLAAARLGMKPETFSRALSQLKSVGVSVDGADVKIASFANLVDYCCAHCSALPGECPGSRSEHGEGTKHCDRTATCPGRRVIKITEK